MSAAYPFDSAEAKIRRARYHLNALDKAAESFLESQPYSATREFEADGRDHVYRLEVHREPPDAVSLALGDFLYNARGALDHLVYGLAHHETPGLPFQSGERLQFPLVNGAPEFEEQIRRRRLDGISPQHVARIKELQPYVDDPLLNRLFYLRDFSNADKHRRLLTLGLTELRVGWWRNATGPVPDWVPSVDLPVNDAEIGRFRFHTPQPQVDVNPSFAFRLAVNPPPGHGAWLEDIIKVTTGILDAVDTVVRPAFVAML